MRKKVCEVCLIGTKPRNSFNSHTTHRSTSVLNVIHSDVCSPLEVPSGRKETFHHICR